MSRPGGAPEAIVPVSSAADTQSSLTVWVAFGANLLIAAAKSVAALLTGSASMVAEAAHSWADTGNEVFLLIANKRSRRAARAGALAGIRPGGLCLVVVRRDGTVRGGCDGVGVAWGAGVA